MEEKRKIIDRIVKLFALGEAGRNPSEAETLAAVTKAREIMARHQISMAEIEMAKGATAAEAVRVSITQHRAYTRKGGTLAQYDHTVAEALSILCDCQWFLRHPIGHDGKKYTSIIFVGDEADTALAGELFLIWLQAVRKAARTKFGGGKNVWTPQHTAYAVGFGIRLCHRARDQVRNLSSSQQQTWGLILASKANAIQHELEHIGVIYFKEKRKSLDALAWDQGYQDGGHFNINTRNIVTQTSGDTDVPRINSVSVELNKDERELLAKAAQIGATYKHFTSAQLLVIKRAVEKLEDASARRP